MKSIIVRVFLAAQLIAAFACFGSMPAYASSTDISTTPMVTSSSTSVKPNVMFVLDDSGSMADAYMPDVVSDFGTSSYGYYSSQCNGLAYDPSITYTPPVNYLGVSYPDSSVTAAWTNGFKQSSGTTNLSTKYYYTYSGGQTTAVLKTYYTTSSTFYTECATRTSVASTVFTKVLVSSLSTAQKTNYANWYSYYRTRLLAMKTAAGLAFANIDNRYRIGFMSINNNGGTDLLNISAFDATQKSAWYTKLYDAVASGSTPTRSALAIAGRIFANKISSYNSVTVVDPMQYSCQQNFAIMATDGFWNSGSCNNGSAGCYNGGAGTMLDGSTNVGNQDSTAARPFYDGSLSKTVVTTVNKTYVNTYAASSSGCSGSQKKIVTTTVTTTRTVATTDGVLTSDTTSTATTTSNGSCQNNPTVPASTSGTTSGYPTTTTTTTGTSIANTMADVAYYYYQTDLRSSANGNASGVLGADVASNIVPGTSKDAAAWQHMTTFTLGLGAYGRMNYSSSYESDSAGDYYNVKAGTVNSSSSASPCSWVTAGGTCNWPTPASDQEENMDDLWHAAVNGRGTYYAATDATALASGLSGALSAVTARIGSASAATTSSPNATTGDNYVFRSTYVSQSWYGELVRQQIDLTTGEVADIDSYPCAASICDWSAQSLLDAKVSASADTRAIYTYDPTNTFGSNQLKSFLWSNLSTAEKVYFSATTVASLSQYASLSTANQTAAVGENLVNFLRGQRANEGTLYNSREHILGDIVSSEAVYLKAPQFSYLDSGYTSFKSTNTSRTAMVYVGANDGMLHAFNATTGAEAWAYIPSLVLPNLYKLADTNYANNHQFFVDGSVVVGDICVSSCTTSGAVWKTILVGGLNAGGRGYYALDVTDPATPKALWEFTYDTSKGTGYTTDEDLGYSFGNPIITKNSDGSWVVLVTSGYNNVSPGTGGGYLFVLDAASGAKLTTASGTTSAGKIATGVGSTGTISGVCTTAPCPSGLARINAWSASTTTDNTSLRAYGGDLFGNLWRFDINNTLGAAGYDSQHLATFTSSSGARQPVTTKPELGLVKSLYPVVFVGTGRYLGTTDVTDTSQQSFYAIKDALDETDWGVARTNANIVAQVLTSTTDASGTATRTITSNAVAWASHIGWYFDLPGSGERSNTDPTLVLGVLAFTTNLPSSSACTIGGESFLYQIDYTTGSAVSTGTSVGTYLGNVLSTRAVAVGLSTGTVVILTGGSDGSVKTTTEETPGSTSLRRVHWRELNVQ